MRKRLVMGALLSILLVGLTGCPPTQVSNGLWVFTITYVGPASLVLVPGLFLGENGQAEVPLFVPPEVQDTWVGTFAWMQNGSNFTLSHVANGATMVYTGTVNSSTSMDGTFMDTSASGRIFGTWTAYKP